MHDLPLAFEFSDEIAVLDEGRIKIQAPPSELCDSAILGYIFGIRMGRIEGKDKYYYES
jgi:ABC-type cobalamin/Fe3+-siderophores transport system ATPase subunit